MRNFNKALACAVLACSVALARGIDTNLTRIKIRELEPAPYMMTGNPAALKEENSNRDSNYGSCIAVMGFYEANAHGSSVNSTGAGKLGAGLGIEESSQFEVRAPATFTSNDVPPTGVTGHVDSRFLLHNAVGGTTADDFANGTVKLSAEHQRYGAHFAWCQDLSNFYDGLMASVCGAVVGVRNKLENTITETTASAGANTTTLSDFYRAGTNGEHIVADNANHSNQAKLTRGIYGTTSDTEVAFNDLRGSLSLRVVDSENTKVCVGVDAVVPTGKPVKTTYLFSPEAGNRHFRLGAHAKASACVFEGSDYTAKVNVCGYWHYSFKRDNEERLPSHTKYNQGHYFLGYKKPAAGTFDVNAAPSAYIEPVINLLPNKVDIKPGNLFNGTACLAVEKGCLCLEAGYNFFYTQDENNDVRNFEENSIYIVHPDFKANSDGGAADPATARDGSAKATVVKLSDLTYNSESQAHHHVFGSAGVMCKDWEYPCSVNVCGGYEWVHNRTRAREAWSVALKGSCCF